MAVARSGAASRASMLRAQLLAIAVGALFGLAMILDSSWTYRGERRFTLFDDAMISMSYARTLASTGELVWYQGADRVEGITNPLWTLVMALLHSAGLHGNSASLTVMMVGLLSVLAAAWIAGGIVTRIIPGNQWGAPLATLLVALCYPLLFWATRGMEVGLLALLTMALIAAGLDVAVGQGRSATVWLSVLVAIGLAVRLDFLVIAAVVLVWLAFVSPREERLRRLAGPCATLVLALLVMTVARWIYYGDVLPNTYTLKVSGIPLFDRLERGAITALKLAPVVVIGAVAAVSAWRRVDDAGRRAIALLAAIGLAALVYSVYAGGDAWEFMPNRYVAPTLLSMSILAAVAVDRWLASGTRTVSIPAAAAVVVSGLGLAASRIQFDGPLTLRGHIQIFWGALAVLGLSAVVVLFAVGSRRSSHAGRWPALTAAVGAVVIATSMVGVGTWVRDGAYAVAADQDQSEFGLALRDATVEGASLAVSYAGAPIYYSERSGVDLLGKSDAVIAASSPRIDFYPGHNKWDYSWSITRLAPDVVADLYREPDFAVTGLAPDYDRRCFVGSRTVLPLWVRQDSKLVREDPRFITCEGPSSEG